MEPTSARLAPQTLHAGSTILVCVPAPDVRGLLHSVLSGDSRKIYEARTIREAFGTLARDRIAAIICQDHLPDGSWQDLQSAVATLPDPPNVLVLSDTMDEGLWPEVLNLGAYDVLVTPLDKAEVLRLTGLACQNFHQKWRREPASEGHSPGPLASRERQRVFAA
jgi:DNA-binding response OmpR family regulator